MIGYHRDRALLRPRNAASIAIAWTDQCGLRWLLNATVS
jgi:hypothetical protein